MLSKDNRTDNRTDNRDNELLQSSSKKWLTCVENYNKIISGG